MTGVRVPHAPHERFLRWPSRFGNDGPGRLSTERGCRRSGLSSTAAAMHWLQARRTSGRACGQRCDFWQRRLRHKFALVVPPPSLPAQWHTSAARATGFGPRTSVLAGNKPAATKLHQLPLRAVARFPYFGPCRTLHQPCIPSRTRLPSSRRPPQRRLPTLPNTLKAPLPLVLRLEGHCGL